MLPEITQEELETLEKAEQILLRYVTELRKEPGSHFIDKFRSEAIDALYPLKTVLLIARKLNKVFANGS
jgi:hypothetical protein